MEATRKAGGFAGADVRALCFDTVDLLYPRSGVRDSEEAPHARGFVRTAESGKIPGLMEMAEEGVKCVFARAIRDGLSDSEGDRQNALDYFKDVAIRGTLTEKRAARDSLKAALAKEIEKAGAGSAAEAVSRAGELAFALCDDALLPELKEASAKIGTAPENYASAERLDRIAESLRRKPDGTGGVFRRFGGNKS
jgi:hypothetical protein